jgi:hypothetical protein
MENNKKYIIIIERLFDVFKEKKIDIFLYLIELIKMEIEIQVNVMTEIGVNRCIKILKSNTIKAIKEKFEKKNKNYSRKSNYIMERTVIVGKKIGG